MNSKIFEKHEETLIGLLDSVYDKIDNEKFGQALNDLKNCEELIKLNPQTSEFLVLAVLHNYSLYYQKTRDFHLTAEYLNRSLSLLDQMQTNDSAPYVAYVKRHAILKTLQLCSALSFEKNHQLALKFAKKSLKDIYELFEMISNMISKNGKKIKTKKGNENFEGIFKAKRIIDKVLSGNEPGGFLLNQEWVHTYSIGNMMTIQPFQLAEWTKTISFKTVSSVPFISKSVFLLVGSHFIHATESRILELSTKEGLKSKDLFTKTLALCKTFFPPTSSLSQHIQNSFKKNFRPVKKEEKKSIVPTVRRIYTKRNSEKPRNTSEKSVPKQNYAKVTPPRKLTPSTRISSSKTTANRLKKVIKGTSSRENLKYSSAEMSKSSTMFREISDVKVVKRLKTNVSDSESFDCKGYLVQEFKDHFVMTSNLLYGDYNSGDDELADESGADTFRNSNKGVKESRIEYN
jgi:hypothetical protein